MEFDELGRLRPKKLGLGPTQESKLTHAPNLGPKLPNLVRSNDHVDSPEKLSHASKISIFEKKIEKKIIVKKESVMKKTNSSINLTINNAGDPNEVLERSSSFSTLVGNPNSKIRSLSRKLSISVGTNLEKKNRKESISALTPTRTVRGHLRSMNSSIDSPGKRKLSPESTNSTLKKMRSGKQTTGDSNQPQTGFHF